MTLYDCAIEDETGLQTVITLSSAEILNLVAARMGRGTCFRRRPKRALMQARLLLHPLGTHGEWEEDDWSIVWQPK